MRDNICVLTLKSDIAILSRSYIATDYIGKLIDQSGKLLDQTIRRGLGRLVNGNDADTLTLKNDKGNRSQADTTTDTATEAGI